MAQQHFIGGAQDTTTTPYTWKAIPAGADSATATITPGIGEKITGVIVSDQPGTLHIQQSGDNTHWDVDTTHAITANVALPFTENILLAYAQIYFTNGGANPTNTFRLYARVSSGGPWVG